MRQDRVDRIKELKIQARLEDAHVPNPYVLNSRLARIIEILVQELEEAAI